MKPIRLILAGTSIMSALLFTAAVTPSSPPGIFTHTVAKGESISLLCIQYYGHYSNALGQAIMKDNPTLTNINVIVVGQKLRLHSPVKATDNATAAPPSTPSPSAPQDTGAALFVEQVNATQGVVTYTEGSASLQTKGSKQRQPLKVNTIVYPGDLIETGSGRVELIINRETVVRLRENTRLNIASLRDNKGNKGKTRMDFSAGSVWTKMRKFKDKFSRFELQLPTAIAGVHGTVYQTTVNPDSSAEVKVFNGEVAVKNRPMSQPVEAGEPGEVAGPGEVDGPQEVSMEQWTQIVRDMQRMTIDKQGKPGANKPFTRNQKDSWEQWNEERDRRIATMFGEP